MLNKFSSLSDLSWRHILRSSYSVWPGLGLSGAPFGTHGMGVPPSSPNPDSISDQSIPFFHTHSQARALKSIPVFRTGPWVIALRETSVKEILQFQHLFASNMCSPTRETCAPLPRKHISLVICVPLPRKYIFLVICVPLHRKHISLVFPSLGNTYS